MKKETKIISAFPGTGKTHFFNNSENIVVLDSDSSYFDKSNFPQNYIEHIKQYYGKVDYILVSSHIDVRKALIENNIHFIFVYPSVELKQEYIARYKKRGSSEDFINLINVKWDEWIKECYAQKQCLNVTLPRNTFISDIIK